MNMMGQSPWGHKESDTTEQLTLLPNMKGRNITVLAEYRKS